MNWRTIRKTCIAIVSVLMLGVTSMIAQQAVTRVEGFIRDESTSSPVECKIYIVGPSGKKQTISSNAKDGSYLAVINEAGEHKLSLGGYRVYRKEYTINVPPTTKFQEIKQDYTVKALREGEEVLSVFGFEKNSAVLNQNGKKELNRLMDILKTNQEMTVIVNVFPDQDLAGQAYADSIAVYQKAHAKWDKDMAAWKKKNKKKQITEPPVEPVAPMPGSVADPNTQIMKDRQFAVITYLRDVKNSDLRVTAKIMPLPPNAMGAPPTLKIEPASEPKTKSKKKKGTPATPAVQNAPQSPQHNNLIVKVGSVKRLFD